MSNIKPVFRYITEGDKEKFKRSKCLLTISVGQEVHEAEKFDVTVDLVNASFDSCILLIDDSLQRHTMALYSKENAEFFYETSLEAGNQWLERNKKYYNKLISLEKIIRWDDFIKTPDYSKKQIEIKDLLEKDVVYKNAFIITVDDYLNRNYNRISCQKGYSLERARNLCFEYLIEECAALCLWIETACQFELYPGRRNLAMEETHRRFILPTHPTLLHAVGIKFKNRRQLNPQKFLISSESYV